MEAKAWLILILAGTFLIGIFFFKDPAGMMRILSFLPIITYLIGLKLSEG